MKIKNKNKSQKIYLIKQKQIFLIKKSIFNNHRVDYLQIFRNLKVDYLGIYRNLKVGYLGILVQYPILRHKNKIKKKVKTLIIQIFYLII